MCGAILDTLAAELALGEHEQAMVIDAQFTCDGQVVDASFFMFPGDQLIRRGGMTHVPEGRRSDDDPAFNICYRCWARRSARQQNDGSGRL